MTIKTPTANFVGTNDILDEKYTTTKSKGKLVKQLNVFEEVVVRRTGVAVLVVMTVDQKFDYWFQSISLDKCLKKGTFIKNLTTLISLYSFCKLHNFS